MTKYEKWERFTMKREGQKLKLRSYFSRECSDKRRNWGEERAARFDLMKYSIESAVTG
jgi:hypothetical protein